MSSNIGKYWENGQVDLAATSTIYEIAKLRGGESITIKALSGNSGAVYIGKDRLLSTSNGFQLSASDSVTLALPLSFGKDNEITINAVCATAGDDICFIKLIDSDVKTEAG